jgi:hypothetical protein
MARFIPDSDSECSQNCTRQRYGDDYAERYTRMTPAMSDFEKPRQTVIATVEVLYLGMGKGEPLGPGGVGKEEGLLATFRGLFSFHLCASIALSLLEKPTFKIAVLFFDGLPLVQYCYQYGEKVVHEVPCNRFYELRHESVQASHRFGAMYSRKVAMR